MAIHASPNIAFRKKFGIPHKGGGPPGLPLPPKGHPLAKPFARAVLSRAAAARAGGNFAPADIDKQVRKANVILYGTPSPTAQQKAAARQKRMEREVAYHFAEAYREALVAQNRHQPQPVRESAALAPLIVAESGEFVVGETASDADRAAAEKTNALVRQIREAGTADARAQVVRVYGRVMESRVDDKGIRSFKVLTARVGRGNSKDGNYYTEDYIDDMVAALPGSRSFYDHPTPIEESQRPERSVLGICGYFGAAEKAPFTSAAAGGKDVPGAYAWFYPAKDERIEGLLLTCQEQQQLLPDKEPLVAFSMNALAVGAVGEPDGKKANVCHRMTSLRSVDLVTQAGAEGQFIFEESDDMSKTKSRESGGATISGSAKGLATWLETNLAGIDIRTPAERLADNTKLVTESRRAAVRDLLANPKVAKPLLESIGVAVKEAYTDSDVDDIAEKSGMVKGGHMHTAMSKALMPPDNDAGESDDTPVETEETDPEDVPTMPASEADVDAMEGDAAKMMLKNLVKARKAKAGTESRESGGKSAREIALERELQTVREARALDKRDAAIGAVLTKFEITESKVGPEHVRMLTRELRACESVDDMIECARDYKTLHLAGATTAAGTPAYVRESRSADVAPPNALKRR